MEETISRLMNEKMKFQDEIFRLKSRNEELEQENQSLYEQLEARNKELLAKLDKISDLEEKLALKTKLENLTVKVAAEKEDHHYISKDTWTSSETTTPSNYHADLIKIE